MLNVVELALNLWKHPHSRALLLCFLAPILALFFYLAGVSSVDVDRANVCAPLLKDHRRLETQITELEALVRLETRLNNHGSRSLTFRIERFSLFVPFLGFGGKTYMVVAVGV